MQTCSVSRAGTGKGELIRCVCVCERLTADHKVHRKVKASSCRKMPSTGGGKKDAHIMLMVFSSVSSPLFPFFS